MVIDWDCTSNSLSKSSLEIFLQLVGELKSPLLILWETPLAQALTAFVWVAGCNPHKGSQSLTP